MKSITHHFLINLFGLDFGLWYNFKLIGLFNGVGAYELSYDPNKL